MTEASPIVFLSNVDESEHKSLTTVGQVLDHSEVSGDELKRNIGVYKAVSRKEIHGVRGSTVKCF